MNDMTFKAAIDNGKDGQLNRVIKTIYEVEQSRWRL